MKKLITLFVLVFISTQIWAQSPQKLSYQAVIRNSSDQLIVNQQIGVQISILQGSISGSAVYVESQATISNSNGLITFEIGNGNVISGIFANIDWSNGPYFIKTETDPTGGTTYTISGTSELLSVPFALHAITAENISGGIVESDPIFSNSIAHSINSVDTNYWNNKIDAEIDGSVTNEIQALSISNDTIYLSNGGFVKLPASFDGQYANLTGKPTAVSAFTNDVNYLTTEIDGSVTNEIQALSISNDTIYLSNGGFVKLPAGFDGQYASLTGKPTAVSEFTNDLNYLTSFTEADPKIGANISGYSPKWNGTSLVAGSIYQSATGKVGIGTTDGTHPLEVRVPGIAGSQINLKLTNMLGNAYNAGGSGVGILFAPDDAAIAKMGIFVERKAAWGFSTMHFLSRTSLDYVSADLSNSVMSLTQNGFLGIGTTVPGVPLSVKRNSYGIGIAVYAGSETNDVIQLSNTNVESSINAVNERFHLANNGTNMITLYNSNVGIGNTNPATALDVNGIITASGGNSNNWDSAFAWGNHGTIGYLTSFIEADPLFNSWDKTTGISITSSQMSDFNTSVSNNTDVMLNSSKKSFSTMDSLKLDGIQSGAHVNVNADWNASSGDAQILNKPTGNNQGDMLYWNGTTWIPVAAGIPGQFLKMNSSNNPEWSGIMASITTTNVTAIAGISVTSGGNITNEGAGSITARGVCWSTSPNPTISSNKTMDGNGSGVFSSSVLGLTAGTTYYLRAYATNEVGTSYGNQISFITISIGDSYEGGIVAYILQDGDPGFVLGEMHGIIAAPSDQSAGAEWGCIYTTLCSEGQAAGQPIGKGIQNTNEIIANCATAGIAARLCADLVIGAYSDWYLPSYNELTKLYLNKTLIGGFFNSGYWSSSEGTAWYSYELNFASGTFGYPNKNYTYRVRAVRYF